MRAQEETKMNITILSVGKIKEPFYRDAIEELKKRLSRYIKLQIVEVSDEKTPESASEKEKEAILNKEGERLLKRFPKDAYVIALAIEGRQLDSVQFSKTIQSLGVGGVSHIAFVIGGSFGLSKKVLGSADMLLSFSKMTFPHQLMRVILLEQVYRSMRMIHNEPYHK